MTNFTTADVAGSVRAAAAFPAILIAPGFMAGFALDLFGFRSRSLLERLAWSTALSFAIAPIMIDLCARFLPPAAIAWLFGATVVAMLALLASGRRSLRVGVDDDLLALGVVLTMGAATVIFELVDIDTGGRLFPSVTALDQAFRVSFINALAYGSYPPSNPLYHPGAAMPLRYYYFWYTVCALCMKLAGVTARQALIASSLWIGFGLTAMTALYGKHFLGLRTGLRRFILTATLLLAVTGLDILPVFYNLFVNHDFSGDLEWWSTDQIASWLDTILWVPHHGSAFLCCLVAILLIWRTQEGSWSRGQRISAMSLAGVAAASACGLSVYVALGCALLMAGWAIALLGTDRGNRLPLRLAGAAAVAAVLALPFARDLAGSSSGTQGRASAGASHLLQLSIRRMIDPDVITGLSFLRPWKQSHPDLLDGTVRLLLLAPGYALELGVFGMIAALAAWRWRQADYAHRTLLGLLAASLLIISFLRSSVIGNNDFGYRAALIPSFLMLLLAAEWFQRESPRPLSGLVWTMVLLGLAGTAFQALMLRVYVPTHVAAKMPGFATLPEEGYAVRTAYEAAAGRIPPQAVMQANLLDPARYLGVDNLLYSEHAMAADAALDCGSVFGGDPSLCVMTQASIRRLYAIPAISAGAAQLACRQLGINYLEATSNDPAWADRRSWVWSLPLVADDRTKASVRVVNCGDKARSLP